MCGKEIERASYLNHYKYLGFFQNSSLSSIFFLVRGRVVDGKIHRQAVETQRRGHKLAS